MQLVPPPLPKSLGFFLGRVPRVPSEAVVWAVKHLMHWM